jgi:hypothetical protein
MKFGGGGAASAEAIPGRLRQRFFKSVGLNRNRFATWADGSSAVKATA